MIINSTFLTSRCVAMLWSSSLYVNHTRASLKPSRVFDKFYGFCYDFDILSLVCIVQSIQQGVQEHGWHVLGATPETQKKGKKKCLYLQYFQLFSLNKSGHVENNNQTPKKCILLIQVLGNTLLNINARDIHIHQTKFNIRQNETREMLFRR